MATKQISNDRLKANIETLGKAGNLTASPGTRLWAIAVRLELQSVLHDAQFNAQQLKAWRDLMKQHAGYRQLVNEQGKPFKTYEELCKSKPPFGLGWEPSDIDKIINELESEPVNVLAKEAILDKEKKLPSNCVQNFCKLVQAYPKEQPINSEKIQEVLGCASRTAQRWKKKWEDLGWIQPYTNSRRGTYQITKKGCDAIAITIPHNSKKAAQELINFFDADQLKEIYALIGKSLKKQKAG